MFVEINNVLLLFKLFQIDEKINCYGWKGGNIYNFRCRDYNG